MVPEANRKLPLGKPLGLWESHQKKTSSGLREEGTIYLVELFYNIVFMDSCQLNT